jgi:K+/H+ antiporter YhaU regulatory subunit KhtT
MADELTAPAPAEPQAPDTGAAPVEPTPAAPAGPDYPAELARLRAENDGLQKSWNALERVLTGQQAGQQQAPDQTMPLVRLHPAEARRVAQSLGGAWTEEAVQQHAPIFAAFLQVLAGPILNGLEGMADVVDLIQARQEVPKYETLAEEVDRVRSEYRQRGQTITRRQAVAAVKARRMEDPKYMDTLLAERETEKAAEQQRRAANAAAAITEGGATVQKAGPDPTKQPRAPQSKEEFARLPLEEKRKILEGATL